jgi:hypothetical protein
MDQESLISLLRADADRRGERTPACPDEHELAAYVDGALPPPEVDSLEVHLADCGWCLAVVGFLSRQRESPDGEGVSETQVAAARKLVTWEPKRWGTRASGWAAAAAVAFLSVFAVTQYSQLSDVDHDAVPASPVRATRNVAPSLPSLQVLAPGAGATVDGQHPLFRWSAVQGSDYYDIRIVSDSGDLIAEQRVEGTEWRPVSPLALQPGTEYFVQVEAHPSQAKTISSDHVPFLVSD